MRLPSKKMDERLTDYLKERSKLSGSSLINLTPANSGRDGYQPRRGFKIAEKA
jgi:hypothetical protein